MADLILINQVRVTPSGFTWPGTHYDTVNDVAQYNLVLSAGGIFWPASDPIVSAQADIILNGRRSGVLDPPTAQALMLAAVISSVSAAGAGLGTDLASTAPGEGASLVGINDAGGIYTAATVEAALQEVKLLTDSATQAADLAATTVGDGASLVGINDAGTVYTATDVEGALQEVKLLADSAVQHSTLQLSPNHPLVGGTVTVATLTFTASTLITPIRNNPDPVAANWGALSITASTPGAPGSITVTSSNALDTSSVDLLLIG